MIDKFYRNRHKLASGQSYHLRPYDCEALLDSVRRIELIRSSASASISTSVVEVRLPWYVRLWNWIKSLFR